MSSDRQIVYACSVSDSVAVPGPPFVSTLGRSTILNASISLISTTVEVAGSICGNVTPQKSCQRLAPSTTAASFSSTGRLSIEARRTMKMNGVHCQTSPIITASRDPHGLVTQDTSVSPKCAQSGYSGPLLVSVSMRNRYATPTGVIIIG